MVSNILGKTTFRKARNSSARLKISFGSKPCSAFSIIQFFTMVFVFGHISQSRDMSEFGGVTLSELPSEWFIDKKS